MLSSIGVLFAVSQVVVYPDRAQVTRTMELECGPRALASFDEIPPAADPGSLRAHTSVGAIAGLQIEERSRKEAFSAEARAEAAARRLLLIEQSKLQDARTRSQLAARIAQRYDGVTTTLLGREMALPAPNTKAWGQAIETTLAARLKAAAEIVESEAKLRALGEQLQDLDRRRERIAAGSARTDRVAAVQVACPPGKRATVELTYLVGGAAWEPAYEARVEAGAVDLAVWATVRQSTGEEWRGARIILSTAVPRQNATPPERWPLKVWSEERAPERKILVRREEAVEHAEAAGEEARSTRSPLAIAAQGLSVQLALPERADVAGDDTPARLFVAKVRLKGGLAFRASPRLAPFFFRVADLTNSAPFPLLPGALDAFRNGGFVARYALPRTAEGQRFHLTFGIEESLRITRTPVEELQRDRGIFGQTRRFRYAYRFEIANFTGRAETVEVADQVPISELDDVKVAIDATPRPGQPSTTPGFAARTDDGVVTWRLALSPGERKVIDLAFHVDLPASYDSGGL